MANEKDELEKFVVTKVFDDFYELQLDFVKAFLLKDDEIGGWVLVDSGYPVLPGHPNILIRALDSISLKTTDIKQIIISHGHADHIGNIGDVEAQSHAPIWMSAIDAPILEHSETYRATFTPNGKPGKIMPDFSPAPVAHRVIDGDVIPFAGDIDVIATPGHCAGQISLLWHRHGGILFTVDTATNLENNVTIAPSNEDYKAAVTSLEKLRDLHFARVVPSHGLDLVENAEEVFKNDWLPRLIRQASGEEEFHPIVVDN